MATKKEAERLLDAMNLCSRYWGHEAGEANDFALFARKIRNLGLSQNSIADLRDWLPDMATGTTGDKIKAIDKLLGRME